MAPDGPEIFSRTIQSTVGIATGIIAFSAAMGALIAVASTRAQLYLTMVGSSLVLLGLAVWLTRRLMPRFGWTGAVVLSAVAFLVVYGTLIGLLPSLGNLGANVAHANQFGYGRAATETPQAITNILSTPLHVNGKTIQPGQIVYPGFSADVLWKFRWYSILNQLLIWTTIALVFGTLLDRFLRPTGLVPGAARAAGPADLPDGAGHPAGVS